MMATRRAAEHDRVRDAPQDSELDPHLEFVRRFLYVRIDRVLDATERALRRFDAMKPELGDRIDLRLVSPLGGETHKGGERPLLLTVGSGRRVVLKPVSAGMGTLVERVQDLLNSQLALQVRPCRVLATSGDAAVFEFATGRRRLGRKALEQFYLRAGAHLGLAHALAITDLHFENLVAWGAHPALVDLETCLYRYPVGLDHLMFERTGLLQPEPGDGGSAQSGIQGGGRYYEIAPHIRRRSGRAVLSYRRPTLKTANRPLAIEGEVKPYQYSKFVQSGCEEALRALGKRQKEVLAIADRASAERPLRTRQLARFSAFYEMLKLNLFQPLAGRDEATSRAGLRDALRGDEPSLVLSEGMLDAEVNDMIAGDTPYFWADAAGYDLRHHSGVVQKRVWRETALEQLRVRVGELADASEAVPRIATLLGPPDGPADQPKDDSSTWTG
jgi:lantibiotic modifying enzyme